MKKGFILSSNQSIHIFEGSLAEVKADVLVSSDDNYLTASGGVARALSGIAGEVIEIERKLLVEKSKISLGDIVKTSGGKLPCRFLYHAITIDFDTNSYMSETVLKTLVKGIFNQANKDGANSIGLPALGTGTARFPIELASKILIEELFNQLAKSSVQKIIISLVSDNASSLFYDEIVNLVRSQSKNLSIASLRQQEQSKNIPATAVDYQIPDISKVANGEIIEQVPNLVDLEHFNSIKDGPKLVYGLADLILKHAKTEDIERYILRGVACEVFVGSTKQRLVEFLYLSEENRRISLSGELFRTRDLYEMAQELTKSDAKPDEDLDGGELGNFILKALGFNLLESPTGISKAIIRIKELVNDFKLINNDQASMDSIMVHVGKIFEETIGDLVSMYGFYFWGETYPTELQKGLPHLNNQLIKKMSLGNMFASLNYMNKILKFNPDIKTKFIALGKNANDELLPKNQLFNPENINFAEFTSKLSEVRNTAVHYQRDGRQNSRNRLAEILDSCLEFLQACKSTKIYPEVLRYNGTLENRDGERFVHFLDENDNTRQVRTDEKIDKRKNYYCFATNNPVHLFPVLIPKL